MNPSQVDTAMSVFLWNGGLIAVTTEGEAELVQTINRVRQGNFRNDTLTLLASRAIGQVLHVEIGFRSPGSQHLLDSDVQGRT